MIKALLFDLGNVLVGLDFDRAYRAAAELGPYSVDEIRARLREANIADSYESGQMSSEAFHQRCVDLLELDLSFEQFAELWGDMFIKKPLLDDHFLEALGRRHRMVVVSNTNELHMRFIHRQYDVLRHFDDFVLSHEVGAMKPDHRFYQQALETAKARPEQCVFIDDKPENILGAETMGIRGIRFEEPGQLVAALKSIGVNW